MKKKLTIVVPLKERPDFTKRFISFYLKNNFKYSLILADGGKNSIYKEDLDKIRSSKLELRYCKFVYDKNHKIFIKKILSALSLVNTKYVMLFDNDDLPISQSIDKCINSLEKNNKIKACGGYGINYSIFKRTLFIGDSLLFGEPVQFSKMKDSNSFLNKSGVKRVENYLLKKNMPNTFNDIFRTKYLLQRYKKISKINLKNYLSYFLLADILNYYTAKILKLSIPLFMHQAHTEGLSQTSQTISEYIFTKYFTNDKIKIYNFLRKNYKKKIINLLEVHFSNILIDNKEPNFKLSLKKKNMNKKKIIN